MLIFAGGLIVAMGYDVTVWRSGDRRYTGHRCAPALRSVLTLAPASDTAWNSHALSDSVLISNRSVFLIDVEIWITPFRVLAISFQGACGVTHIPTF